MNDSILQTALNQVGHNVSRDVLRSELAWLEEQGLVKVEVVLDHIHVAELTTRGLDVAEGRSKIPGIKRPGPKG
ncbi:MAG: ArsR family transcriptional regulator [Alphaproteobacteria bacterium]